MQTCASRSLNLLDKPDTNRSLDFLHQLVGVVKAWEKIRVCKLHIGPETHGRGRLSELLLSSYHGSLSLAVKRAFRRALSRKISGQLAQFWGTFIFAKKKKKKNGFPPKIILQLYYNATKHSSLCKVCFWFRCGHVLLLGHCPSLFGTKKVGPIIFQRRKDLSSFELEEGQKWNRLFPPPPKKKPFWQETQHSANFPN